MGVIISTYPSPYETIFFFENYKKSISLICTILGYDSDGTVDDTILGFLNFLTPIVGVMLPKFDLCSYLAQPIHTKLEELPTMEKFKYPSSLFCMFFYLNYENYKILNLKVKDEARNQPPTYEWSDRNNKKS